jgi:glycosyltransferase involved in cell wall biosynthesis
MRGGSFYFSAQCLLSPAANGTAFAKRPVHPITGVTMRRLRIFTWHVHGNYLWYLSQVDHDFYLPVTAERAPGYNGRGESFPFRENVHEIPVDEVKNHAFDVILFQHSDHYLRDQHRILTARQRRLPRIFLEHDPPLDHPTENLHCVEDSDVLVVHVTPFNQLMWDNAGVPTRVIDHGVLVPDDTAYTGELARGIVVVNNLGRRGRRLGPDVYLRAKAQVPLDLVGMNAGEMGGLGEIRPTELAAFECRYRFFFNPIRYTSLGLAVCEAMTLGMPVVGLKTTEMATAIENGVSGFVDTNVERLIEPMRWLLTNPAEAKKLGEAARRYASERFNIRRFVRDWETAFADAAGRTTAKKNQTAPATPDLIAAQAPTPFG